MEKETIEKKVIDFIKNNNLEFTEGRRNTDSVILAGYFLSLKDTLNTHTPIKCIKKACPSADKGWVEEYNRVHNYAYVNNYGDWWESEAAKEQFQF